MNRLVFLFALLLCKLIMFLMRLVGRRGTYLPGVIALKLCPKFLKFMSLPKNIIAVTGTNGKTTVANMIGDSLRVNNYNYVHNNYGSNTVEGIVACFIEHSSFTGKSKYDYAVIEVDERSSYRVYEYMSPNYLVLTNLFRDSYARNAHADYIFDILDDAIPRETKLILNSDDLISSLVKPDNESVFFSIDLLDMEEEITNSRVKDIENCPKCDYPLSKEFIRYNHIGRYHCKNCNFKNKEAQYIIKKYDEKNKLASITYEGSEYQIYLNSRNIVDLYNLLSSVALLHELGFSFEKIQKTFSQIEVVKSRYDDRIISGKRVVLMMAKAINPISSSRTFDYIRKQEGKKAIVFGNSKMKLGYNNSENTAWLYDNDFSYINNEDVIQYICCGKRYKDFEVCVLLAGIDKNKVVSERDFEKVAALIDYDNVDIIFLLNDIDTIDTVNAIHRDVINILEKREK